jgi:hypothetical protein
MYNDDLNYIGGLGEALIGLNRCQEIYNQQMNALEMVSSLQPVLDIGSQYRDAIDHLVPQQVEMIRGMDVTWKPELIANTLSLQMASLSSAMQCVQTESISALLESFGQAK